MGVQMLWQDSGKTQTVEGLDQRNSRGVFQAEGAGQGSEVREAWGYQDVALCCGFRNHVH